MYSKRWTIENTDLTSGEITLDVTITKEHSASNKTRNEIFFPTSMTCWNNSGQSISLVFLSSGEITDYAENPDNYEGIVVGYDVGGSAPDTLYISERVEGSRYLKVIPDDTITGKIEISTFAYNSLRGEQ